MGEGSRLWLGAHMSRISQMSPKTYMSTSEEGSRAPVLLKELSWEGSKYLSDTPAESVRIVTSAAAL